MPWPAWSPLTWKNADGGHCQSQAPSDAARLVRLRRLAWLIDGVFAIPGTRFRFGLNSLIGLAPAAGDAVLAAISLYIVNEGRQLGLPASVIARMLRNVAIEAIAGAVPVVGDLFDVAFKANLRNIALIEEAGNIVCGIAQPFLRTSDSGEEEGMRFGDGAMEVLRRAIAAL